MSILTYKWHPEHRKYLFLKHKWHPEHRKCLFLNINAFQNIENDYFKTKMASGT